MWMQLASVSKDVGLLEPPKVVVMNQRVVASREGSIIPRWAKWCFSVESEYVGNGNLGGKVNLEGREIFEKQRHDERSGMCAASYQSGWDNFGSEKQDLSKGKGPCSTQKETESCLVKELFRTNEEGSAIVSQAVKPNKNEQEAISPLKPKPNKEHYKCGDVQGSPSKGRCGTGKANLKKVAREIGKTQGAYTKTQEIAVGTKRYENTEVLAESEGRLQKKNCNGEGKENVFFCEETAVAARQHCREK